MALIGNVDELSRRTVFGWAANDEHWNRQLEVTIFVDDQPVCRIPATTYWEGLQRDLPQGATGKYGFEFEFEPALSIFDEHKVEVRFADSDQMVPGGSKVLPITAPVPVIVGIMQPIIITALGRSGTTLLMQQLAKFPEVVITGGYPYEIKLANYYSAAFQVLAADTDRKNSTNPDEMFAGKFRHLIGSNPFTRPGYHSAAEPKALECFFAETVPTTLSRTFRDLLSGFYEIVKWDQKKPGARYFAEKSGLDDAARKGPRLFFDGVRELVLIRDPRDLLCSAKAFWRMAEPDALQLVVESSSRLVEIDRTAGGDTMLLRYEDLVMAPAATMARIADFVGIQPLDPSSTQQSVGALAFHTTSSSPASSIGRWRKDLPKEEIDACERATAGFIERFGYEKLEMAVAS